MIHASEDLKRRVAKEADQPGNSSRSIAQKYGYSVSTVSRWRLEFRDHKPLLRGKSKWTDDEKVAYVKESYSSSVPAVALKYGIPKQTVYEWKRKVVAGTLPPKNDPTSTTEVDIDNQSDDWLRVVGGNLAVKKDQTPIKKPTSTKPKATSDTLNVMFTTGNTKVITMFYQICVETGANPDDVLGYIINRLRECIRYNKEA